MSSDRPPTDPVPPIDPVSSASKGVAEAVIEWSEAKVKELAQRFRDKGLYFIEDSETIETAKKTRKQSEWSLFKHYMDEDKDLHVLFQMGLTLRKLENDSKDLDPLTRKILRKYKAPGLHVAWFVQNGIFGMYLANILEKSQSEDDLKLELRNLFKNIDSAVVFVRTFDVQKKKTSEIITKIQSTSPETFIISSIGGAKLNCENIKKGVMGQISREYSCEIYESEQKDRKIFFLNRKDDYLY